MTITPYHLALYILAAAWGLVVAAAIRSGRSGAGLLAALGYTPILSSYYMSVYQAVYAALLLVFHASLFAVAAAHTAGIASTLYMMGGSFSQPMVDLYVASRSVTETFAPLAAAAAASLIALRLYSLIRHRLRPPLCPLLLEAGVVAAYLTALYTGVWGHIAAALALLAVTAPAMSHVSRASRLASKALLRRTRVVPGAR